MKYFKLLLALGIMCILSSTAWADIPHLINFQGILDSSGNPLANRTLSVEFKIYDSSIGGNTLWSETTTVTTTSSGVFNALLGSNNPIPDTAFNDTARWLGVKVGSNPEITPRQQLVSVPYSYRVGTVDGATGGVISGNVGIQNDLAISGKVGIGTTVPPAQLTVNSGGSASTLELQSTIAGGNVEVVFENKRPGGGTADVGKLYSISTADNFDGGQLRIAMLGGVGIYSDIATFTGTGNIGIGTTSPSTPLHVRGAVGDEVARFQASPTSASPYLSLWYNTFEGARIQTVNDVADGGSLRFFTAAPPFGSVFERVRITSDGNVGIGTTIPGDKLDVGSSTSSGNIRLSTSPVGQSNIDFFDGSVSGRIQYTHTTDEMDFLTAGTSRLRIKNNGNVGIGTASPQTTLDVNGQTHTKSVFIANSSSGCCGAALSIVNDANWLLPFFIDAFNGSRILTVQGGGNVGIGTTTPGNILTVVQNSATDPIADAWTTYSSAEYKQGIHELTDEEYSDALQKLLATPVVKYRYKGQSYMDKEKIGIVIEEAPEEIISEGNAKAASLSEYISLLHAALKAQQTEIESLKQMLKQLQVEQSEK